MTSWRKVVLFLTPSFLRGSSGEERKNNIAALDGLRGVACLIVYNEHLSYQMTEQFIWYWGHGGVYRLTNLPFFRILWSGWSMVDIFFVISGYVLSYKTLKQQDYQHDTPAAQRTVFASVLKRGPRLLIPTWTQIWIIATLSYVGLFDAPRKNFLDGTETWNLREISPPKLGSLWDQAYDASWHCTELLNIFTWTIDTHGDYDKHVWSIRMELKVSMILFALLTATLTMKPARRAIAFAVVLLFSSFSEKYEISCFMGGALLAMLDVNRTSMALPEHRSKSSVDAKLSMSLDSMNGNQPHVNGEKTEQKQDNHNKSNSELSWAIGAILFVFSVYLITVPVKEGQKDPFYRTVIALFPGQFRDSGGYVRAVGSVMITYVVLNWGPARALFASPFSAYLGRVSFALYLVHGIVIRGVWHVLLPKYYAWNGDGTYKSQTQLQTTGAWILGLLATGPLSFWIADIFMRAVDIPCVNLCRRLEKESSKYRLERG